MRPEPTPIKSVSPDDHKNQWISCTKPGYSHKMCHLAAGFPAITGAGSYRRSRSM